MGFAAKIRGKILKSGNFFQNHSQTFTLKKKQLLSGEVLPLGSKCICNKIGVSVNTTPMVSGGHI